MHLGRVPRMSGLALRRTGGISGEGVGATPTLSEVNECRAIGVHTQVAYTPGDRRLHRRQNWREGFL